MSGEDLLERIVELRAVDQLLDATGEGRSGMLVFEAAAGLGKSRLLEAGAQRAAARGQRVIAIRGDELEQGFAWRGVLDLLAQLETDSAGVPARPRSSLALLPSAPGGATGAPEEVAFAVFMGVSDAVAAAAALGVVLLVVDDAHWVDEPTLRCIRFVLARLVASPVGVLLGTRPAEGESEQFVRPLLAFPGAQVLSPQPLSAGAVARVVRRIGDGQSSEELCRRCAEVTGGNPFYVHELATYLAETGGSSLELLDHVAPPSIRHSVLLRLARLGSGAQAVAQALAVLGDGADPHVVGELAGASAAAVLERGDELASASLLRTGRTLRFAHPLIRTIVDGDIPRGRRSAAHAAAARALHAAGAPAERVASHLLEAPVASSRDTVATLSAAAARAVTRGAPAAAMPYLERALLEPGAPESRTALRAQLAEAAIASGSGKAIEHLQDALEDTTDHAARARIFLLLGWALHAAGRPAAAALAFERGQLELGESESALAIELDTGALTAGMLDITRAEAVHRRLGDITALATATTDAELHRNSQMAFLSLFAGAIPADELVAVARPILRRALRADDQILSRTLWNAIGVMSWCDRYDEVSAACDELLDRGRRTGAALTVAMASYARAWPGYWSGNLPQVAEDARRAVDIWTSGAETYLPAAVYWLVGALVEMDRSDEAASALAEIDAERWEQTAFASFVLGARARVAAASGDHTSALALWLRSGAHTVEHMRALNPTLIPWRAEAAMLADRLGESDRARTLVEENLMLARRFGAPRALGEALRVSGLTAPGHSGIPLLRDAVAVLAPSPARLEQVRALIDLGSALRRAGRPAQAREQLRAGRECALRCDAVILAGRAGDELEAAGARPARRTEIRTGLDALTERERLVAELAASRMTNRQIAAELYVTVKAVEWHLRNVYRKLAISGRTALLDALDARA